MIKLTVAFVASLGVALGAFAQDSKKEASGTQDAKKEAKKGGLAQDDARMMREMAQSDLAEVQAGKVGAQKASSGEVKKFAQHMVDDHGKQLSEARDLAKKKNMQLPSQPMKKHQDAMKKLEQASGQQFDKVFMQQMVKDHEDALKLAQNAAKNAKDKDVKAAAEKAVPVIQNHLEEAKKIASSLK
jgi:putative membrane protein